MYIKQNDFKNIHKNYNMRHANTKCNANVNTKITLLPAYDQH